MYCECTPSRASKKDLSFMWSLFHKVIAINIWCAKTSFGINTTCFIHLKFVLKTILPRFCECPLGCTTWDTIMLCRLKTPPIMKGIWNPYIYISAYLTKKNQRSIDSYIVCRLSSWIYNNGPYGLKSLCLDITNVLTTY